MALENLSSKVIAFPIATLFACAFIVPTANSIALLVGFQQFYPKLEMGFSGGVCGIYLLAGWAVKCGI